MDNFLFEQDRFLVRLQQRVMSDRDIAACFLSGSYGRRQEDSYSDLDIGLVFESNAAREEAWQRRRNFVNSILNYVPVKSFDAAHIRPYFHVALYSTGTKADFRFETSESLLPNPFDKDLRIIKDRNGQLEPLQAESTRQSVSIPRMTAESLRTIDERFWVMYWDTLRLVLRGDFDKPFTIYVELLHFTLPPLIAHFSSGTPTRNALQTAYFDNASKPLRQHLRQLLDAYLTARNQIVQTQHLDIQFDTKFEAAIQQLINKHAK